MSENSRSNEQIDQANQILKCAYLAAIGDAELTVEELEELEHIRPVVNRWIDLKEAVEHYEETDDFEAALEIFPPGKPLQWNYGEGGGVSMLEGVVPPFLSDLHDKRTSVTSVEEAQALIRDEASKINDGYMKKVAANICGYVCGADGEVSELESLTIDLMCEVWGTNRIEIFMWFKSVLEPIYTGEPPSDNVDPDVAKIATGLTLVKGLMDGTIDADALGLEDADDVEQFLENIANQLSGENKEIETEGDEEEENVLTFTVEIDEDESTADELFDVESHQNSFLQASICIYLAAAGDGDINEEEIEGLVSATNSLAGLYDFPDELDPVDYTVQAQNIVQTRFDDYEEIPEHLILQYAEEVAKNITHPYLQRVVALAALVAADYDDDLDENELEVLNTFLSVWGLDWDEVRELEGEFQVF